LYTTFFTMSCPTGLNRSDSELRFDPLDDNFVVDPYSFFAAARSAARAFYSSDHDCWVVTRYNDMRQAFQNTKRLSASNSLDVPPLCPMALQVFTEANFAVVPSLTNTDHPHHTRIRRLANLAFTAKRVADMETFIRASVIRFIDERFAYSPVDLVPGLTWEMPHPIVFRFLGIPDEDISRIQEGADNSLNALWGPADEASHLAAARGMIALWRYVLELVANRVQEPRDDFTTALLQARSGDLAPLSTDEICSILFGLLVAGHETTSTLLTNGFHRLLADRAAWEAIGKNSDLIPNAIEEALRIDSPAIAWRRKTTEAVEIGGISIPAEATVMLLLGSANRDPAVFEDPDRFDIYRANARKHLAFGFGDHLCLGAPIARLQARVVFEEFSTRFPSLRLVAGQTVRYRANRFFRAPLSPLRVEWD
jgi:cytochrome P450